MEHAMVDLSAVIGVYPICNTGAVLVHAIDYGEEKVMASINGQNAEWCKLIDACPEGEDETELGFNLGSFFVPLSGVMRFCGGGR